MAAADRRRSVRGTKRNLPLVLVVVGTAALIHAILPMTGSVRHPSNQRADARKVRGTIGALAPPEVSLDDLKQPAQAHAARPRNPFKFYVTPPTPKAVAIQEGTPLKPDDERFVAALQPSFRPIPIKFIGIAAQGTKKVAIFSDGKGSPVWASEGETVLGQYRLLKISVQSVTMSYLDGSGTQTIPMRG